MPNIQQLKRCSRCERLLPYSAFNKQTKAADGLQCYCKECARAHRHSVKSETSKPAKLHVETEHPVYSKMQQREIINEIRDRIKYLRSKGWDIECKLEYVETKTITI